MSNSRSYKTLCVHGGKFNDSLSHGSVTPIFPATSHAYLDMEKITYPRYYNTPNQEVLAAKIAALEHGEAGLVFASGMAAISTTLLALLRQGDHAVVQTKLYGGTTTFINNCFNEFGISFTTTSSLEIEDFKACLQEKTRLIFIETPSNPLLQITDIAAVAKLATERGIITVIDNTFASPVNQNPLDLGIDIVVHSATKYLGGHSDICAGAVISNKDFISKILHRGKNLGGSLNAQTCSLLERSIKTLALRMEQHNRNAQAIAEFLDKHANVQKVYYPGLPSHDGYELAKKQMRGFSGMLSFELIPSINPVIMQKKLKLINPSMSLGGVESTICSPTLTSHSTLTPKARAEQGISDNLLRLSVGVEETEDIIHDLKQALDN